MNSHTVLPAASKIIDVNFQMTLSILHSNMGSSFRFAETFAGTSQCEGRKEGISMPDLLVGHS